MRTLVRLILIWLIVMPLGIYLAFPHLVKTLETRTKAQAYAQCLTQTATQPQQFPPEMPAIAEHYCHCLEDGVTLDKHDVITLLKRQSPDAMNARVAGQVQKCTDRLANPAPGDPQILRLQ